LEWTGYLDSALCSKMLSWEHRGLGIPINNLEDAEKTVTHALGC